MAAGIEAGHPLGQWEAVRTLWGPYRLSLLQDLWRAYGPPAYVSLGAMAGTRQPAAEPPERAAEEREKATAALAEASPQRPNPQAYPSHVLAELMARASKR